MLFAMPYFKDRMKKLKKDFDVKAVRRKLGLSRVQLAAKLGSSYESIGRWERGDASISMPYRRLIERIRDEA